MPRGTAKSPEEIAKLIALLDERYEAHPGRARVIHAEIHSALAALRWVTGEDEFSILDPLGGNTARLEEVYDQ